MKNLAIARRYAKALLLIGKEDGQAETYREELDGFADLIDRKQGPRAGNQQPPLRCGGRKKVLTTVIEKLDLSKVMTIFSAAAFRQGADRVFGQHQRFLPETGR